MNEVISGNKETFALEYSLMELDPMYGDGRIRDWGYVKFWVNGRNLLAMKDNKPDETYHWYLRYLVGWFSESLNFIMDEEDILLDAQAENSFILLDKFREMLEQHDFGSDEHIDLHNLRLDWNEHHNIVFAAQDSWLPDMYIRAIDGKIEICWDNSVRHKNKEAKFLYVEGVEYVSRQDFIKPVIEFIRYYIKLYEDENWPFIEELKGSLNTILDKNKLELNL